MINSLATIIFSKEAELIEARLRIDHIEKELLNLKEKCAKQGHNYKKVIVYLTLIIYVKYVGTGSKKREKRNFKRIENEITYDELSSRIKEIIKDRLGYYQEINDDNLLTGDMGADEIDLCDILMAIENEFNIKIDDADFFGIANLNVKKLIDLVIGNSKFIENKLIELVKKEFDLRDLDKDQSIKKLFKDNNHIIDFQERIESIFDIPEFELGFSECSFLSIGV